MARHRFLATPLLLALAACSGTGAAVGDGRTETGWVRLFDGTSLAGWTPKIVGHAAGEDPYGTFRVEDGVLVVDQSGYGDDFAGRFGHLFHAGEYDHYLLRAEYRFVGEQTPGAPGWAWRNSGLMLHGERPEEMGRDQAFPVSIEVQLLGGGDEGERPTANLCTPGTHVVMGEELVTRHCTNSSSPTFRGDGWVTVEVEVHGNGEFVHRVEGEEVLRYRHPQLDANDPDGHRRALALGGVQLGRGTISIQSEGHAVHFRRIELLPLAGR